MKRAVLFGLLALAGGFAGAMVMHATVAGQVSDLVTTGSGEAIKFDATNIIANVDTCTTSTTFVDMPEVSQAFKIGGHGGALTFFQGRWFNNTVGPARVRIRHVVDTVPSDEDPGVWTLQNGAAFGPPGQINGSSGMNFLDDALTPGPHVITIQWRSQFGQQICVSRRTLIVLHR
jgi:hypothetical protein